MFEVYFYNYRGGFGDRAEYLTNFASLATSVYIFLVLLGIYTHVILLFSSKYF